MSWWQWAGAGVALCLAAVGVVTWWLEWREERRWRREGYGSKRDRW